MPLSLEKNPAYNSVKFDLIPGGPNPAPCPLIRVPASSAADYEGGKSLAHIMNKFWSLIVIIALTVFGMGLADLRLDPPIFQHRPWWGAMESPPTPTEHLFVTGSFAGTADFGGHQLVRRRPTTFPGPV